MSPTTSSQAASQPLYTDRLILRPTEPGDGAVMAALAPGEAGSGRSGFNQVGQVDVADGRAWIARARMTPGARTVAIVEVKSGDFVGAAGIAPMADNPARHEVALWIADAYTGRGFATEASQRLIDHCFSGEDPVPNLWCVVRVTNARGRRVIEKCGFQYRESGMSRSVALRGMIPVERFVLERRTWLGLKRWGSLMGRVDHADYAA